MPPAAPITARPRRCSCSGRISRPGIVGKHPSLTDLDQGDLKFNMDFRSVYATVLQNWLDTPSKPILGQQFPTLPVLKA